MLFVKVKLLIGFHLKEINSNSFCLNANKSLLWLKYFEKGLLQSNLLLKVPRNNQKYEKFSLFVAFLYKPYCFYI